MKNHSRRHRLFVALVALTGIVAVNPSLAESRPALQFRVVPPSVANEFSATPELTWSAEAGVNYVIQSSTNLASPNAWQSVDLAARSTNGPIKWMPPESLGRSKFFRVFTQPLITEVQPAWVNSEDAGALLYLTGQLLPSNGIVVINGQNFSGATDSNGVLSVSLNGLPPGTPITGTISVLDAASNVVATLPVQSPILYGPTPTAEMLQGPPTEPPASPDGIKYQGRSKQSEAKANSKAMLAPTRGGDDCDDPAIALIAMLSKKGYDYWQAQSDLSSAGLHQNPYFHDNELAGEMPGSDTRAAFLTKKGYDYYQAQSALNAASVAGTESLGGTYLEKAKEKIAKVAPPDNGKGINEKGIKRTAGGIAGGVIAGIVIAARSSGEVQAEAIDLAIPGAMLDFAWTRTYRSRTGPTTAQGAGWDFSFNVSLTQNGNGTLTLRPGNGRADTFYQSGTNWVRDEYFCEIRDLDSDGYPDVLFADTGKWLFIPSGPAAGKLRQIVDRNGNAISLNYDTSGNLATIVDDLGRTNSVGYDTFGRIAAVTDFTGRSVRYEYSTAGDLVSVISPPTSDFPGGITNRMTYTSGFPLAQEQLNHNLTSCIDGKGQTQFVIAYSQTNNPASEDYDTVISTQRGIEKKDIKRGMVILKPSSRFAATKIIVRDALGNVSEEFYDSRGRCVRQLEYTGRAPDLNAPTTETENRPTNKLRAEDPDYFETQWAWNRDSLCTLETLPDGQRTQFIYESDFNSLPSARKKGDCRVVREFASSPVDLDGDGLGDITERAWHFDYDPRFGSPMTEARGIITKKPASTGGTTAGMLAAKGIITTKPTSGTTGTKAGMVAARGIVTAKPASGSSGTKAGIAEARGIIAAKPGTGKPTAGMVAARGIIAGKPASGSTGTGSKASFVGNAASGGWTGFVISATDPRGNVTTAEYDPSGNCYKTRKVQINDDPHKFAYNPRGQLTAITNAPDANGYSRVDTFSYYTNGPMAGQLQSVVIDDRDRIGLKEYHAFEYDAVGNLTRYVDPRTNDWLFTYNALDQCIMVQSPVNKTARTTRFASLDGTGNLTDSSMELRDANDVFIRNVTTHYDYDAFNRCTAMVAQVAPGSFITNRFEYDANDNLIAALSPQAVTGEDPHAVALFEYDERGLLFREIVAPGSGISSTNQYDYDALGTCARVKVTANTYVQVTFINSIRDGLHRPSSITDAMGNETRFNYDRNGNCTLVRFYGETNDVPGGAGNILLAQSSYKYDGRDNVLKCTTTHFRTSGAPVGDGQAITTFAYAPNGACTNITDDNGLAITYDYDAAGRVYLVKTPRTVVQTHRDTSGNVTGITQTDTPDGGGPLQQFSMSYGYDSLGRCIANWDNVGNTNRYAYDSLSRLVRETDPRGVATVAEYDDLGYASKLWVDQNADGNITSNELVQTRTRNVPRLMILLTDGNQNTTRYGYDSLGNCTSITNADNTVTKLVWSPRSNLLRVEDPNGTVVTNTYDLNDRLIHRDIAVGAGVANTTTFENFAYDGAGRCVLAQNNSSTNTFEYDSLGNCVRDTQRGWAMGHLNDNTCRRLATTYPSGLVVNYAYNSADDLTNISVTAGTTTASLASFAYDGPGNQRSASYLNGVSTTIRRSGLVGVPNAPGDSGWQQVASLTHGTAMGPFWTGTNKWDAAQNSTQRNNFQLGALAVEDSINFALDGDNRLVGSLRVTNGITARFINYVLDINGNRQLVQDNGVPQFYTMDNAIPPGDFQMNRYTQTPFGAQAHDHNGNLLSRISTAGQTYYAYDYADRLVSVSAYDAGAGAIVPVASYDYDALGQRIRKTVPSSSTMLPPVVTDYLHLQPLGGDLVVHGPSPIAETRVNGALLDSYIHRTDDGVTIFRDRAGGSPVFYHSDDLGNTVALTDAGGNVVERYTYDDFGLPHFHDGDGGRVATNASPAGNLFLFGGMEWDPETGLYFHQNPLHDGSGMGGNNPLYEDPKTGRAVRGKVKNVKDMGGSAMDGGNPWSLKKEEGGRHTPFHNKYRPQLSSAKVPRNVLKEFFEKGDKPTQAQFDSLIDSKVTCPGGGRVWPQSGY